VSFNTKKYSVSGINLIVWLDVVTDGLIHLQLHNFCQNTRLAFLGRNTTTPLISEILTQLDDTMVETVYRNRSSGGHVDWTPHLRKFANMKIQVSHFRGGFGITPNEGSAIWLSTVPPARLLSGWAATGVSYLTSNSQTRGRPGRILPPSKLRLDPFYRHFRNRMFFSFRIKGVSNGPLGLFAPACV